METRDELLAAVEARLRQAAAADLAPVLALEAADEAQRLASLLTEGDGDLHARYLLGMLHWHRSQGLPSGQDLSAAVTVLTPCFAAGIGAFPPVLARALAEQAMPPAIAALQRMNEPPPPPRTRCRARWTSGSASGTPFLPAIRGTPRAKPPRGWPCRPGSGAPGTRRT
jgi:hypothetical protein